MPFAWTARQFVGGALCLDFANTVIYPGDPARRYDRIEAPGDLRRWAESANRFAAASDDGRLIAVRALPLTAAYAARARRLRDSIDALFRPLTTGRAPAIGSLRDLLALYGAELARPDLRLEVTPLGLMPRARRSPRQPLLALVAHSAVALAFSDRLARIKACPSCDWLFLDRSKANRRVWCDMLTCGNRAKARRHYRRRKV